MSGDVVQSRRSGRRNPIAPVDPETAQYHIAAYFAAYYSSCQCDTCKYLRPVAEKVVKSFLRGRRTSEGEKNGGGGGGEAQG